MELDCLHYRLKFQLITFTDSFKQTVFIEFRDINTNQFPEKDLELIIEEGTDIVNLNKDIE